MQFGISGALTRRILLVIGGFLGVLEDHGSVGWREDRTEPPSVTAVVRVRGVVPSRGDVVTACSSTAFTERGFVG